LQGLSSRRVAAAPTKPPAGQAQHAGIEGAADEAALKIAVVKAPGRVLQVDDSELALRDEDIKRMDERFFRRGSAEDGSGLGG